MIILSVRKGNCPESENIFQKIFNPTEVMFDILPNPSIFDHFKRRSDNTKHTFGNNKDMIVDLVVDLTCIIKDKMCGPSSNHSYLYGFT